VGDTAFLKLIYLGKVKLKAVASQRYASITVLGESLGKIQGSLFCLPLLAYLHFARFACVACPTMWHLIPSSSLAMSLTFKKIIIKNIT